MPTAADRPDADPAANRPADGTVDVARLVSLMRETGPLVHCLTNSVVRQITADVLLAAGAAPAMVDHPDEAGDFAAIASGVLVNVGNPTAEQVEGMHAAIASACDAGTPWVLDPVAVGGLVLRTRLSTAWLESGPAAIRANASETIALAGTGAGGRGVDSTEEVAAAEPAARDLSARSGAVVAVTGPRDLVVTHHDGLERATWVESGHPLLQKVIGTGCALGALTAAYLGAARAAGADYHDAVVAAHAHAGAAGTVAGRTSAGPGSFAVAWLDALYTLTPEDIAGLVTVTAE
ncbi:hydroxyethylthiazole kinase [Dietzia cinnamea]|uniref:Hydroxyethylthiazole kinase n=1 Tax=Dietzia cinnamea TaxID=321318 RepID=A0A4R3ZY04_9ACTN|nr:hydroxyethylthiazole kinase [Dietzia cinnamea]TCW25824.1 hydroxyethylthiazole kinase [Dietzia cinnamea]